MNFSDQVGSLFGSIFKLEYILILGQHESLEPHASDFSKVLNNEPKIIWILHPVLVDHLAKIQSESELDS